MPVTNVDKDVENLTLTIETNLSATVARAWELWNDPRQLERWWGPPEYPATFVDHDLTPGGRVSYYMTGPEGDTPHGYWHVTAVNPPNSLEFEDGFANENGAPDPDMPIMGMKVFIVERGSGGTRMSIKTTFASKEAMEQILEMGMDEGMSAALGQIDAILAEG